VMLDREKIALFENHNSNLVSMGPGAWIFAIVFVAVAYGFAALDTVISFFATLI
jgi:hypothetical protein